MRTVHSLAIDYGAKYIGISLIAHTPEAPNRVLYAAVIVVQPKPLKASVRPRVGSRRLRRGLKTRRYRLRGLAAAIRGIPGAEEILRFSRRRGYGHDRGEDADDSKLLYAVSRESFFEALAEEIQRVVPARHQQAVLKSCRKHLNAARRPTGEPRPARFENRHPSKCQWKGCTRNVPRKKNAPREQLTQTLFNWLKPIHDQSQDKSAFRRSVEHQIDRMVALIRLARRTADRSQGSPFAKLKKRIFADLRRAVADHGDEATVKEFGENWSRTYSKQLNDILGNEQSGRLRFCREHSKEYTEYFLAGKVFPQRTEVLVSDLFGRSQQIVFQRIWRLVEARLLPLARHRIDRVVVERTAFDVLAGTLKQRTQAVKAEDRAAEMYWHGPMFGYANRLEMLKKEFDGLCGYCGQSGALVEVEHILPKSRFPFDSYFNIVPACPKCNHRKGARSALEADMTIHQTAYDAYASYVKTRKPPHVYHTIKKGMLKLMTRETGAAKAQQQLALLANDLATIAATQKGPRPLARFLAVRIEQETGRDCRPKWISGRHTAVYREITVPELDKQADKQKHGLVNHAVDAIVAGCKFPSVSRLENPKWSLTVKDLLAWRREVCNAAPKLLDGLPEVEPLERLDHFEQDLGGGYFAIDLSAFNWNRQRQSGVKLDPFGQTADGQPLKRKPADAVLSALLDEKHRDAEIESIAHRGLRGLLRRRPEDAAEHFVRWLQESTRAGMSAAIRGRHPSDEVRYAALEEFIDTPAAEYLRKKEPKPERTDGLAPAERKAIPETIGIRCTNDGVRGKLGIARRKETDGSVQYYAVQAQYRALYVGYRAGDDGRPDRTRPVVLAVDQAYRVSFKRGRKLKPVSEDGNCALQGRVFGHPIDRKAFVAQWRKELGALFHKLEIIASFRLTQGCFVEKTDGTRFQLRNFDDKAPWMKNGPFQNIARVWRSPLHHQ